MSARPMAFPLSELRAELDEGSAFYERLIEGDTLRALVDAVAAAQVAWEWIDAVARTAESHASRHGATVARQNLSIALLPFEESA